MLLKLELDVNVSMGDENLSVNGCGLQGYLPEGTTYKEIVYVFGEPQRLESMDNKVQVEWIGRINGLIFTIYDYKSDVRPEDNKDWHIGGKYNIVVTLLKNYFAAMCPPTISDDLKKGNFWWGYHHQNGSIHVKRFFSQKDIREALESDFVMRVTLQPFIAVDRADALKCAKEILEKPLSKRGRQNDKR